MLFGRPEGKKQFWFNGEFFLTQWRIFGSVKSISFCRKTRLISLLWFSRNSQLLNKFRWKFPAPKISKWDKKCRSIGRTYFSVWTKAYLSLHGCSQKSQWHNGIIYSSPIANFIQIGRKMLREHGTTLFTPLSKVCLLLHRFSRNSRLLNRITWKSFIPNLTQICE